MKKITIYNNDYVSLNTAHWFLFHSNCVCDDCAYQHTYDVYFEFTQKTETDISIDSYHIEDETGKDVTSRISVTDDIRLKVEIEDWVVCNVPYIEAQKEFEHDIDTTSNSWSREGGR